MALFETVIGGIAASVFDGAIKTGKYAAKEVRGAYSKVEHEQRVIAAADAYRDNYWHRHCQIKILPGLMKEPLDLESVYTDVKILDDRSIRAFIGMDELESAYREKGTRGFGISESERLNGMKAANDEQFLMVLGGPGIGKSTFLRKIGLEVLKKDGTLEKECIPVFLELKKFREEEIDIQQKIVEEFEICKFPAADVLVAEALEQGKLLVLFDGLDEVPSDNLNQVIEKIENFVDQHDKNSFVASCRIAAYRSSFRRFTDVTISEFDDDQIAQFITRWFGSEEDKELETAEKYLELLGQKEHAATKELAQTPLLLTFLCLVYDREQTLPNKRSTLYGQALNIILSEWSAQKRLARDPIYEGFHPDLEKEMLSKIAYESFKDNQLFFSKDTITDRLKTFLADTLDAPKGLNSDNVLKAIEVQQGILVERATDAYSFSHLTLQEYLAALYIVENRLDKKVVEQHVGDKRWREVFILIAGLIKNPVPRLLEAMKKKASGFIKSHEKVKNLVKWAAVNTEGQAELYQRAGILAITIAFAVAIDHSRDSVFPLAVNFDVNKEFPKGEVSDFDSLAKLECTNASIDLSQAAISAHHIAKANAVGLLEENIIGIIFASAIVFSRARNTDIDAVGAINSSIRFASGINGITINTKHQFFNSESLSILASSLAQHRKLFLDKNILLKKLNEHIRLLESIWLEALNINQKAITFSFVEVEALKNYLYATELIIRCQQSAVRVSRSAWEALESKLLTWDFNPSQSIVELQANGE